MPDAPRRHSSLWADTRPDTRSTSHDACELAEKLRATIPASAIFQPDDGTRATVSIGVTAHQSADTIDAMLARVDKALYRAKREGRNCVRAANELEIWADLAAAE